MLRKLENLQGVTVLSKEAQKKIAGGGTCGVKIDGVWENALDGQQSGMSKEQAQYWSRTLGVNWCCDSCPWNQTLQNPQP
jgi:hypothetical protein